MDTCINEDIRRNAHKVTSQICNCAHKNNCASEPRFSPNIQIFQDNPKIVWHNPSTPAPSHKNKWESVGLKDVYYVLGVVINIVAKEMLILDFHNQYLTKHIPKLNQNVICGFGKQRDIATLHVPISIQGWWQQRQNSH